MNLIKWFLTYWCLIFIPFFYCCWKIKHKERPTAVLARLIYFITKTFNKHE